MRFYPALIVFLLYLNTVALIHFTYDPLRVGRGIYIAKCRQPLQIECVHTIKTEVYEH